MPSFSHEILVDLFRNCGELAPALLGRCAAITLAHARVEQGSIDFSQVTSTEYRADAVVVLRDQAGAAVAAIIVEAQLSVAPRKRRSWPVYLATLHADLRCPVYLLVVTPFRRVARWARRPIALGHPGFDLTPIVIGFEDLPRITEPAEAAGLVELAVLSAVAHPEAAIAKAAFDTFSVLPEDKARLYWDPIMAALPAEARKTLEMLMKGYVYQSDFAKKYYGEGREKGLEEGREKGLRTAALAVLRSKLEALSADDEAALAAVHTEVALTALIAALLRAATPAETRAALTAAHTVS